MCSVARSSPSADLSGVASLTQPPQTPQGRRPSLTRAQTLNPLKLDTLNPKPQTLNRSRFAHATSTDASRNHVLYAYTYKFVT